MVVAGHEDVAELLVEREGVEAHLAVERDQRRARHVQPAVVKHEQATVRVPDLEGGGSRA